MAAAAELMLEVALAMLERDGRWLVQLRDDIPGIVAPGCWGLFGGHLEPGESPEQAVRRELQEEISWCCGDLPFWFRHSNPQRIAHFFRSSLPLSLDGLQLLEGQDMTLAGLDELAAGEVWSPRLQQSRPLAPSLQLALETLRRNP
uniref:NUDIX hydrolase n=1 Tax=Synechococcus sp. CS-1329 TaxID=2847975 RepID=UPI00223BC810|nr:NUDIX hydrolase [Synechococcus sp. CS-1329]